MPYLNIDDGMDEHPKVDALSDAAFRGLFHELMHWSRTGEAPSTELACELIASRNVRRAPRHWLPEAIRPRLRYRAKIPRDLREAVYERDGEKCLHCGALDDLTLDHIVPWSTGGMDDITNLQTLCRPCNSRKGARI